MEKNLRLEIEQKSFSTLKENNGFTIMLIDGSSPTDGYSVSKGGDSEFLLDSPTDSQIKSTISRVLNLAIEKKQHFLSNVAIGGWVDEKKTNLIYIELSVVVKSQDIAMSIAKSTNQKSIFSFRDFKSIDNPDYIDPNILDSE
jgi:hypothetical protein